MTGPTLDELRALDDELASEGFAVRQRPQKAAYLWATRSGGGLMDSLALRHWFDTAYAELHPSVNFADQPFGLICVSAHGVAYGLRPPIVFGHMRLNPMEFVEIKREELERIHAKDPAAYWELYYQAADGVDLFTSNMNRIDGSTEAGRMIAVGYSELEASARQLIAGTHSSASLAHSMCVMVETISKGVLVAAGASENEVIKLNHRIPDICATLAKRRPGPNDAEYLKVAAMMPALVASRYKPEKLSGRDALDLYRKALFLSAEALRRTSVGLTKLMYRQFVEDPTVPPRIW